jgi:hypothetical protein
VIFNEFVGAGDQRRLNPIQEPGMLLRLLFLISLLGYATGPDAREKRQKLGGESFGTIVNIFVGIGAIVLLALVVIAIMAVTGYFESDLLDPIT